MEAASRQRSGEIHVIVGPMFAGKTTTLLRKIQSERSDGRFDSPPILSPFFFGSVASKYLWVLIVMLLGVSWMPLFLFRR